MSDTDQGVQVSTIYDRLGIRPFINAGGNVTVWGGSTPSAAVQKAMEEGGRGFVEMAELLQKAGDHLAGLLGVEAAYPTSGCYAALVQGTAACIAGRDGSAQARLPDTTGLKNEILLHKRQRYAFDRAYTMAGGQLVEFGDEAGATAAQLEAAIGPQTAAVAYFYWPGQPHQEGCLPLEETAAVARARGVPVIVDAASQIYPLDYLRATARAGDLVCFGGKYFKAPHSVGFLCGRRELVAAVADMNFLDGHAFGRPMKLDRQEIAGLVAAVDEWFAMDHEARTAGHWRVFDTVQAQIQGLPAVRGTEVVATPLFWQWDLHIELSGDGLAEKVVEILDQGTPRIRLGSHGEGALVVSPYNLEEGEELIVAERLHQALGSLA